jgi:hypothetical protein
LTLGRFTRRHPAALAIASAVAIVVLTLGWRFTRDEPSAATGIRLSAQALGPWSAQLQLTVPPDATSVQIARNGRMIDRFPAAAANHSLTYTDHLLWPGTGYDYEADALDGGGTVRSRARAATTTVAAGQDIARFYAPSSFWNQAIAANPTTDDKSAEFVQHSLVADAATANLANTDQWGIALVYANTADRNYVVGCRRYGCQSSVSFRFPALSRPTTGSDHHLTVIDPSGERELDMWLAVHDRLADRWAAGSRYVIATTGGGGACAVGTRCGSAVASGFAEMGGIIRPEEIAQGHIDHALFITVPRARMDLVACPASGTDGTDNDPSAIPEGAQIQLDPAFDVESQPWPRWEKIIARAFQVYGGYVGDTGGSLAVRAEATLNRGYEAWSQAGTPSGPSLTALPWHRFRVLDISTC